MRISDWSSDVCSSDLARQGNVPHLECVYHQWAYELNGDLMGVPFRRGIKGKGGMPADFDLKQHGLVKLRVEALNGLVFATFSQAVEPLTDYLGPLITKHVERIMCRPIKKLGNQPQFK